MKLTFTLISQITIFIGALSIFVFGFLLETQTPQVERLIYIRGNQDAASLVDQRLEFRVNQQLDTTSLELFVEIVPQVDFSVTEFENTVIVQIDEPLQGNTEYTVRFPDGVRDVYGNRIESTEYTFTTQQVEFAYLDPSLQRISVSSPTLEDSEVIFETSHEIVDYVVDDVGYIIAEEANEGSILTYKDTNGDESILNLEGRLVTDISASEDYESVYIVAGEVDVFQDNVIPLGGNDLFEFNIESMELRQIELDKERFPDIIEIEVVPDGSAILIKGIESSFFLLSTQNYEDYVELGKFLAVEDFNRYRNLYLAVESPFGATVSNFPFLTLVNASTEKESVTSGEIYVLDPRFLDQDTVVYSSRMDESQNTRGFFGLNTFDIETQEITNIVNLASLSVEYPVVSPDERFIAVEIYNEEQLQDIENIRSIGFQSKPGRAEIGVYDIVSGELVRNDIQGIEARWVY